MFSSSWHPRSVGSDEKLMNDARRLSQIVGPNIDAGEKLQLLVGSNVWKKSCLLDEDIDAAGTSYLLVDP